MVRLSCIVLIGIALACVVAEEELYSDQYDDIDVKAIFENEKLRQQYYKCLMDTAPCKTAPMKFFKGIFPESFQTQCKKCTETQKKNFEYIIDWYTTNEPDEWSALITKILQEVGILALRNYLGANCTTRVYPTMQFNSVRSGTMNRRCSTVIRGGRQQIDISTHR